MSKDELEMWEGKLRLFLTLHGGMEYWKNGSGRSFCIEYCPFRKGGSCEGYDTSKRLCINVRDIEANRVKIVHKIRKAGDWCAEWIKNA